MKPATVAELTSDLQRVIQNSSKDVTTTLNLVKLIQSIQRDDGALVVDAIQKALEAALVPFDPLPMVCRRKGVGRGAATSFENQCKMREEAYGALCYPMCEKEYEKVGCCVCRKKGCSGVEGFTDLGASCTKPAAYGRGAGYGLWEEDRCKKENGGTCEKNGLMWYSPCKAGFHSAGCCKAG
ncbi:hypothetical protein DYB32_009079 [Aphanomyces invadans]|uniref:Uncharacterized protein n=1 Tax=Aphanomyces invadans TaxID=157072 RepID=A0A418AJA5_9STRA|nr:hypothetical protein DYB32_009079 [Aphanomyces invadans]